MPSKFTDAQRDECLALVRDGVGYREIANRTGVSRSRISAWAVDAGIITDRAGQVEAATEATKLTWAKRKGDLADLYGEAVEEFIQHARAANDGTQALKYMLASAVGVDKAQVITGGVTSRHEVLDVQRRRNVVESLGDELAQRRNAKDGTTGG